MHTSDVTRPPRRPLDGVAEWLRPRPVPWDSPKFWITQCGVLIVMTIHTLLRLASIPTPLTASLMLIPVLYAAFAFGVTGAIATASWATVLFAGHWFFLRSAPEENDHVWIELVNLAVLMASGVFVGGRVEVEQAARRRTEAALQLAAVTQARYRGLFEDQPSPVIVTDSHDVVTELNTAAIGLLGSAAVGRVLGDSLGLNRAELFLKELPVTVRSAAGAVRNYVPTAHEIDVGDGRVLVQIVLADVTEQCRRQEEQRAFTGRVLQVQEEERLRLARELHDDPLQQLMYLARTLEEIAEDPLLAERLVDLVGKGRLIARSASTAVRTLILGLRPPMLDDLGLVPALRQLIQNLRQLGELTVGLEIKGPESRLPAELELTAYRVVQESLNNVIRHAEARTATVTVTFGEDVELRIRDDGRGMPPASRRPSGVEAGLGLVGLRERVSQLGGRLMISSRPGRGTVIQVSMPTRHPALPENTVGALVLDRAQAATSTLP
ncbi:MAG: ATP-binding protein [Dermatophilaceae bacterium]